MNLNRGINKHRRQKERPPIRLAGQQPSIGAQLVEGVASKPDSGKGDLEPALQVAAGENGSAPPEGVEVPRVDDSAQHPAGTDQESSGDGVGHNDPERAEQTESPPLQRIAAGVEFPLCDAAVRSSEGSEWGLADAILAECSETGADGVNNHSYAKLNMMREEIAKNHGVDLSFERVRKLRQAASAFTPSRRRLGVSLEGHLEAGTPEALDRIIANAPEGTAFTRKFIRQAMHPTETAEQENQQNERRHDVEDKHKVLQDHYRQLERENEFLKQHYTDECRSSGKEPQPLPPQEGAASRTVAEDLEHSLRVLLMSRGFDPAADNVKQAIRKLVTAVSERP
jgi:hypothetical protein